MDVREKLVELLGEIQETGVNEIPAGFGCTREYIANEKVASHLTANGVTVQEWISVTDRLPEFCVSVLARCFYHGKWRTRVCHTSKENAGEWYTDEVGQWVKVTHWMTLPPPPKEG